MAKPFARGSSSKTIRSRCYQFSSRRSKRNGERKLRETKSKRSSSHKTVRSKAGTAAGTQEEGEGSGSSKGSLSSDSNRPKRKRKRRRSSSTGGRSSSSTIPPRIPATSYPPEQELFLLFFFLAATASSSEHALLPERMGEGHSNHSLGYNLSLLHDHTHTHQQQQRPQPRARHGGGVRVGATVGEIVEVQGGHIVRSIGRKDRHSKVCTAKGPRDRRVRLSAHTAIQFYDVQDRLGYDRPSKAVDWLIKNAKAAIDELAELPPWSPSATVAAAAAASSSRPSPPPHSSQPPSTEHAIGESSKKPISVADPVASTAFNFGVGGGGHESTGFLPPSLDTDSIADTIKSFFPMATAAAATSPSSSPSIGFQTYLPDLPSRTSGQVKDLRLSLQSFQDSIFHNPEPSHHQHHHTQYHESPAPPAHNAHFPASAQLAFDTASVGWAEQSQRIVPWSVAEPGGGGGSGGYLFSFPQPQALPLHSVLGQSQFFSQRGPLQSSNAPAVRAWADPVDAATDHRIQPALYPSISSSGFTSGAGFSGFHIPARFQGEEEHDGITDKPPSASSASRN